MRSGVHDDRVLPFTRGVSLAVLPFLAVAVAILYLAPGETAALFAWTIAPPVTAMLLASAYAGGIWFFVQVLRSREWHRVGHGFPAVLVFATLAGVATVLHWDRFHFWHVSFVAWTGLYLTTPFAIAIVLAWNAPRGRREPGEPEIAVPRLVRVGGVAIGAAALLIGGVAFVAPGWLAPAWPWPVTPLTARILGAVLTLPGMVNLGLLLDDRWSAFRVVAQAQLVSLVLIVGAFAVGRADLSWERPSAALVVLGLAASLVAYALVYTTLERRMRAASASGRDARR